MRIHIHKPKPNQVPIAPTIKVRPRCGHTRLVGTCSDCQQSQLGRWSQQLRDVS